jgi:hypothetical protein
MRHNVVACAPSLATADGASSGPARSVAHGAHGHPFSGGGVEPGTIDSLLAKSDDQVGLEVLLGILPSPDGLDVEALRRHLFGPEK